MYNLKPLDELHRVPSAYTPAVIDTKKGAFFYKLCQGSWSMKADYYSMTKDKAPGSLPDSCKNKYGNAYFVNDGDCKYSFKNAAFDGIMKDQAVSDGYKL